MDRAIIYPAGFLGFGDLATRFRDGALFPSVWRRRGTTEVMVVARASSRLATPGKMGGVAKDFEKKWDG